MKTIARIIAPAMFAAAVLPTAPALAQSADTTFFS